MFSIVICAYNNLTLTKKCVQSVLDCTEQGKCKIFIVDDGSTDGTDKWLRYESRDLGDNIFYTINDNNMGYVKSAIKGVESVMKMADDPYIFLLNNDVVLLSWWTHEALKLLKNYDLIGAFGTKEVYGEKINFVSGSRLIVKRKVIDKIGMYDNNFRHGYWEDVDFSRRAVHAGFKIAKFKYFQESSSHLSGSTFRNVKRKAEYYNHNKHYLESKVRDGKY